MVGGEFGGEIGGDSYSFSVPTGTESYLRADDIMGSRGAKCPEGPPVVVRLSSLHLEKSEVERSEKLT